MNQRLITVLAFAFAVAGFTSFVLYRLILSHVQAPVQQRLMTTKIVTATHDLQVGALLKEGDVREVVVTGPVSANAIHTIAEAAGRGVVSPIYQDEPVLSTRLAQKGAGAGLAALIPVGMRAVALPINDVVGLAGFVSPGVHVDVLVSGSGSSESGSAGMLCRTILQNIEVLSAGQKVERNIEGKPESAQVVNLLVTPSQAETMNLASVNTRVQLVLRNPLDTEDSVTAGTSIAKLFGQSTVTATPRTYVPAAVAPAPRVVAALPVREPELATVEIFNGTRRSEQKFDLGNK